MICKVLLAHVDEGLMKEGGIMDTEKLDLVARLGENYYTRVSKDSLFEVEKPIRNTGIGVDALPQHIRTSVHLTGNDLGKLGNCEHLPSAEEVSKFKDGDEYARILAENNGDHAAFFELAKDRLLHGKKDLALLILSSM